MRYNPILKNIAGFSLLITFLLIFSCANHHTSEESQEYIKAPKVGDIYFIEPEEKVTQALNDELEEDELFLNLASNEYFKAIDTKALKVPVIDVNFKEFKDGKYKTIAIFAKLARGLMTRYIIDTDAKTLEDVKGFNYENYGFSEELSSDKELVFTR